MPSPRLFSYCIPVDDGAAPNPFWGYCTLAICKPAIRRTAEPGDWIVGTGSKRRGVAGHVVYAMRVSKKLSLEDYDRWAQRHSPNRIPEMPASFTSLSNSGSNSGRVDTKHAFMKERSSLSRTVPANMLLRSISPYIIDALS